MESIGALDKLLYDDTRPRADSLRGIVMCLLYWPWGLILDIRQEILTRAQIIQAIAVFLLLAGLLFGLSTILQIPPQMAITPGQMVLRLLFMTALFGGLVLPVLVVLWGLLQRFSAWFYNVPISLRHSLALSGLGVFYAIPLLIAVMLLSLVLSTQTLAFQSVLLLFDLAALVMAVRLFQATYRLLSGFGPFKSTFIAFFPIIIASVIIITTQILAYMAAKPHYETF